MAQERCVRKTYQDGRLWTPGEIRTARNDPDTGDPIINVHFRQVEDDEKVEDRDVYDEAEVKEARKQAGLRDKKAAIINALNDLDPDQDSHWTQAGRPAIAAVFSKVDFEVTRNDIQAAAPDFDRDHARELVSS